MKMIRHTLRKGLLCTAAMALCAPALALDDSAEEAAQPVSQVRDVILVTAQKREEAITDIPASISVVSGERLRNMGAGSLADFAAYVPGVNVGSGGSPGQTSITLRGIAPVGPGATVSTHIDDTPLGGSSNYSRASAFALDLFPSDIERVEILRGPQGTLYGASAMGGLLRYVTRTPDPSGFSAQAAGEIFSVADSGSLGYGGNVRVNVPLADNAAFSASLFTRETPGYVDNTLTGRSDQNELTQTGGRLAVYLEPASNFTINLSAMFQNIDSADNAQVYLNPATLQTFDGPRTTRNMIPEPFEKRERYYAARLNWDLGFADLSSISSFSNIVNNQTQDASTIYGAIFPLLTGGAVPPGLSEFNIVLDLEKFTQEFRLTSSGDGPWRWMAGVFYTQEDSSNQQIATAMDMSGSSIPGLDPLAIVGLPTSYEEIAVFGNMSFDLTDRLTVGLGGRLARNEQDYLQQFDGPLVGGPQPDVPGESSETVFTYMATATFNLTADTMLYGRIASGYRPGGPNVSMPGVPPQVEADRLVNYEAGIKSDFWDGRALIELTGFWIEWEDIQLATAAGGLSWLTNAGTARSRGIEFQGVVAPVDGLRLGFNAALVDSVLTEDAPGLSAVSGDRLPSVPRANYSLTADYGWGLQNGWDARVGGGIRWVGDRNVSYPGAVNFMQLDSYYSVDLNAEISNGSWSLRGYVRNLTDEDVYLSGVRMTDAFGSPTFVMSSLLQPRTVGLVLSVSR
ncbi:MAG: TonB-dependent receptor [Glycocaulis sp.]